MQKPMYLSIQQKETGRQIKRLLKENGYTVKDVQNVMGFENPQAVYKWISGRLLPSLEFCSPRQIVPFLLERQEWIGI